MSNPFLNCKIRHGDYTNAVRSAVLALAIGECAKVDLAGKSKTEYRATLRAIAKRLSLDFTSKSDKEGALWIKRIV
tara:strand:- start:1024 stop:1251 length:228 start_codon:yes stop_codon:yes gene_type:complete